MKKGTVYWITGLAGSGKTTIGNALYYKMKKQSSVVLLDGDILKNIIGGGDKPGYTKADRLARAKNILSCARCCQTKEWMLSFVRWLCSMRSESGTGTIWNII